MAGTIRIGRILGVPVGVHWSLLGIGLLLTLTMATTNLPLAHPGHDSWVYWAVGGATTAAFFATVLAHEVGHAVAGLSDEAPTPRAEWRIAAAGPMVSVALTGVLAVAAIALHNTGAPSLFT